MLAAGPVGPGSVGQTGADADGADDDGAADGAGADRECETVVADLLGDNAFRVLPWPEGVVVSWVPLTEAVV